MKNINGNRDKWTDENHENLKNISRNFIPLIRFLYISSDDFYDKVHPYERIIPNNIYEDAMAYYLVKEPKLSTEIIKSNLVSIITNWIDRKDSNVLSFNNKYKFNLIYKKRHDGFDCMTFHNKCNGQGPFIVLIKLQSKKIYGGYNPIGYAGRNRWVSSSDRLVFSFENDQDIHNMKIDKVIKANFSIYEDCNSSSLFNFGNYLCLYGPNLSLYNTGIHSNILGSYGSIMTYYVLFIYYIKTEIYI